MIKVLSDGDGSLVVYTEDDVLTAVRKNGVMKVEVASVSDLRARYSALVERASLEEAVPNVSERSAFPAAIDHAYERIDEVR